MLRAACSAPSTFIAELKRSAEIKTIMIQLIYFSNASSSVSSVDIRNILAVARRRNCAEGLTGVLFYGGGRFMQVLEGEEVLVEKLYGGIKLDPRHSLLRLISKKVIQERDFADWTMAFRDTSTLTSIEMEGFNDVLSPDFDLSSISRSRIGRLVTSFKLYAKMSD
ncbi:MAG: BLUF domain-containing protein [Opitutus sp.]|nr:BLUF domain-containing protein [Opitutus sp.]MCS6277023.1 BLUF domain-containing protein [Opitutus sp.]MCS6299930.1 BLUF domain-containing protein [Opitutus sp.]